MIDVLIHHDTSPRPWRWLPDDELNPRRYGGQNLGRIVDANGKTVLDLGNDETYYPSAGLEPTDADADLIIKAVNAYKEEG